MKLNKTHWMCFDTTDCWSVKLLVFFVTQKSQQ